MEIIKNCFNYVGSKDRILPFIDSQLDKSKPYLIDLFCGSGVVSINELDSYKRIVLNDACWQLVETLKYFRDNSPEEALKRIEGFINAFNLSKENKNEFLILRKVYNTCFFEKENFSPAAFYCLVTHAFNYNIHINSSGGYCVSAGTNRSSFNSVLKEKFTLFQKTLNENKDKISIKNKNFAHLIKESKDMMNKFMFYVDPPYLCSDDPYSRIHYIGKWDEKKEVLLYKGLDYINKHGGSFMLSNVIENNGQINEILTEWSKKYTLIDVDLTYDNCNYQRKGNGRTREVIVKNY